LPCDKYFFVFIAESIKQNIKNSILPKSDMQIKRTSIKNIAEKLGVSNATVSLVLSGKQKEGRVSKALAEKIILTAKEMNYQPNSLARSLRVGSSQTIGLIVADISNLFFSTLAFYIQEEAEKYGYTVIITNTNESVDKMGTMINMFRNRQVDGFLIVPTEHSEDHILGLVKDNFPLVLLDRYFPFIETSYVGIDNYKASLEATKLLLDKKCKKIALLIYQNNLPHILERRSGYVDAMAYAGMADNICIKEIRYSHIRSDIDNAINELFDNGSSVDGIFFATNSISMYALKSIMRKGIDISTDVQVVCFDKNDAFDLMSIPIPYVLQPIAEIGKRAVEILITEMSSKKRGQKETQSLKLQAVLHDGSS